MKPFGTSMTTKLTMRAAIALVIASAGATWCLATLHLRIFPRQVRLLTFGWATI